MRKGLSFSCPRTKTGLAILATAIVVASFLVPHAALAASPRVGPTNAVSAPSGVEDGSAAAASVAFNGTTYLATWLTSNALEVVPVSTRGVVQGIGRSIASF